VTKDCKEARERGIAQAQQGQGSLFHISEAMGNCLLRTVVLKNQKLTGEKRK
jgi:hypothetical protein